MKLAWLSDTHFDLVGEDARRTLSLELEGYDQILVTGDIALPSNIEESIAWLRGHARTHFVRGNHDFYRSSFAREDKRRIEGDLRQVPYVQLTEKTVLLGTDGWYDGGYARMQESELIISDFYAIEEITQHLRDPEGRARVIKERAKMYALELLGKIDAAIRETQCRHILVATHVPPFRESSRAPNGALSDRHWAPYFSSKSTGEVLREAAKANPEHRFTVYCGHTHTEHYFHAQDRLECFVHGSDYGHPLVKTVEVV